MDKPSPKTTPKSQLMVFSPDVLKKLGITPQLTKLTATGATPQEVKSKQSLSTETTTNKNVDDNNSQLELALNTSNTNQIKPNETDTNLLLNDDDSITPQLELISEKNVSSIDNVDILPPQSISMNTTDAGDKAAQSQSLIDAKYQLNLNELDPRVAEILTPAKRGRPKGKGKGKGRGRERSQTFVAEKIQIVKDVKPKTNTNTNTEERRRSGRPRKEKKLDDVVYYTETPEKPYKRRTRGREHLIGAQQTRSDNASTNESASDDETLVLNRQRRRNQKKGNRLEGSDDETIIKGKKLIECGVCAEKMENSVWAYHSTKHNYLCWRVGEPPIDLNNRKTVESVLLKVAAAKKVTFTCDKCGEKRKSVVGYLSHLDVCQKTDEERLAMRVECPECHKLMQPCSLKIHMRNHINESFKISNNQEHEQLLNESSKGRVKRNAAKKAQGLINQLTSEKNIDNDEFITNKQQKNKDDIKYFYKCANEKEKKILSHRSFVKIFGKKLKEGPKMNCPLIGCNYEPVDFKDAKHHLEGCSEFAGNQYICFFCYHITENEQQIEKHIEEMHESEKNNIVLNSNDRDDDDDYDYELSQRNDDDDDNNDEIESCCSTQSSFDEQIHESNVKKQRKQVSLETGTITTTTTTTTTTTRSCLDKVKFLANQIRISASRNCTYPAAGNWTQQFYDRNFIENHKITFMNNIIFINENENWLKYEIVKTNPDYYKYLPSTSKSISVKTMLITKTMPNANEIQNENEHGNWKEFQLFEIECKNKNKNKNMKYLDDDTITIYCGGPIWAMAWLPTPTTPTTPTTTTTTCNNDDNSICIVDQILAVSVQRDLNASYKTSKSYASTEAIQFWNFHKLYFKTKTKTILEEEEEENVKCEIKLEFLLGHDHGNVWAMEWSPSTSTSNQHLLALACSDGVIPIYSIYFNQQQQQQENKDIQIFKPIETFKLIMQHDDDRNKLGLWNYQCTKLIWSKVKEYNIIAAGYSNGMVCLWDLNKTSPLLRDIDENGTIILRPVFAFQAHTAAITALHFYYYNKTEGNIERGGQKIRWLFTGSWDRNCFIWDLSESVNNSPIFKFNKRGNVSDGVSINHWLCSVVCYDDVHFVEHTTTSIQNVRDFGFKSSSLLSANSMVMGLAANDWANAIAQVTLAGELCCTFQRQLILGYDFDKNSKSKRFLLSYCEIIDKKLNDDDQNNDEDIENISYEKIKNKYGIIFCDIPLDNADKIPAETLKVVRTSSSMKDAPTEMYPIAAQNRVAWNPNKQAYNYISSGYQSGFLRLKRLRFIHSNLLTFIK